MIIALRIILAALWLIFTNLIMLRFSPGGRYLILLEAIAIGLINFVIREYICKNMDYRLRSFISAIGIIPGFALVRLISSGIRLTVPGLVLAYVGMVCVEMVLPEEQCLERLED